MFKSKDKGNLFERTVYKQLRELDNACKRTLGSGNTDEHGDILFMGYSIECKHYKSLSWLKLQQIFEKHKRGCGSYKPLLIYKENNKPIMCMAWDDVFGYHVFGFQSFLAFFKTRDLYDPIDKILTKDQLNRKLDGFSKELEDLDGDYRLSPQTQKRKGEEE